MNNQSFEAAETCCSHCQLQSRYQSFCRFESSIQFDTQHHGKSQHLSTRQLMLRMRFKTWIKHTRNGRMILKKSCQCERISVMPLNSQTERPNPSQDQPAIERTQCCPRYDGKFPYALN